MAWISLFVDAKAIKAATGCSMFRDLRQWSARDIAAMIILQHEESKVTDARFKAIRKKGREGNA